MTRYLSILFAGLWLGLPAAAAAQNNAAPANVVAPPPTPRDGTVGPEQLRDFALPGTRQATPPAETPRAVPVPTPAPRTTAPATTPSTTATRPPASAPAREAPAPAATDRAPADQAPRPAVAATPRATEASPAMAAPSTAPPTVALGSEPAPAPSTPLPPITVTQSGTQASSVLPGWWPWLLVAVLAGVGLALVRRQRRRPVLAGGYADDGYEPEAPARPLERAMQPAPAPAPAPPPAPPLPPVPPLPTGVVTTRLRQPVAPPQPVREPVAAPQPVTGGIVSQRLRGWIEVDLVVREILFTENEAVIRVDFLVVNNGTAGARDIRLEALTLNGSDNQRQELAGFFDRPAAQQAALAELGPLNDAAISHELKMPRGAIRAYDMQGRTLFVPIIAVNASYRIASGEGRTSAAFLIGREVAGSEKLAPLQLPAGDGRALGLGVRRLDDAVRR